MLTRGHFTEGGGGGGGGRVLKILRNSVYYAYTGRNNCHRFIFRCSHRPTDLSGDKVSGTRSTRYRRQREGNSRLSLMTFVSGSGICIPSRTVRPPNDIHTPLPQTN